jgi:hypothetical protein
MNSVLATIDVSAVKIEYYNGTYYVEITSSTLNNGEYTWTPTAAVALPGAKIRITCADRDKTPVMIESVSFLIDTTANYSKTFLSFVDGESISDRYGTTRTVMEGRTAGEKAVYADEYVTVSQVEAGTGIRVIQRDNLGRADAGDPDDVTNYYKAWNLIVETDPSIIKRSPRSLVGTIDFNTATTKNSLRNTTGQYYGEVWSHSLTHDWNLGVSGDPLFVAGQTANSYVLTAKEINVSGSENTHSAELIAEVMSEDTIQVSVVVKDIALTDTDPSLLKDRLDDTMLDHTYIFAYTLTEVIPSGALNIG